MWAGTDACEPVTWQECKLVPKDVQFIVPEITCSDHQELWYHQPEQQTETRMTNTFGCKVRVLFTHIKKTISFFTIFVPRHRVLLSVKYPLDKIVKTSPLQSAGN